jgi:hypothetical protein
MRSKGNPNTEEQESQPLEAARESDMRRLLATLDEVFATFRTQLQGEVPEPFTGAAKTAVDVFNDIIAGLALKSIPISLTIKGERLSQTEVDLTWTDDTNNPDGYRVKRCRGFRCQDLDEYAQLPSNVRIFRDLDAGGDTDYRYQVVAFNARGEASSHICDVSQTVSYEK